MVPCPQCGQENSPEEIYCVACGTSLKDDPADPPLEPLATGALVAGLYLIEIVEPCGRENRYHAVRQGEGGGRVLLRERASEEAEPLRALAERTAGLTHPALLVPEPIAPASTAVEVSADRSGRVPRAYIECLEDRAIPLSLQRSMVQAVPCQETFSLEASHSPFLSMPRELADVLASVAARTVRE